MCVKLRLYKLVFSCYYICICISYIIFNSTAIGVYLIVIELVHLLNLTSHKRTTDSVFEVSERLRILFWDKVEPFKLFKLLSSFNNVLVSTPKKHTDKQL